MKLCFQLDTCNPRLTFPIGTVNCENFKNISNTNSMIDHVWLNMLFRDSTVQWCVTKLSREVIFHSENGRV